MNSPLLPCIALAGVGVFGSTGFDFQSDGETPAGEPERAWTETSMKHRAMADFEFALGQETWRNLGSEIELFGTEFPVEFEMAMKFVIDTNGDGDPDRDVKGETGFVDLKGETEDGEVFHYGVRFRNEGERKYSWAASGAMVGKVEGLMLSIIDGDANGKYNDVGIDGLVIGNTRGAGFVSDVVNIDGDLFDFEISADGTKVRTRPYAGETGVLKLGKLKGVKAGVTSAIFSQGRKTSFQLAGESRGVKVPVGEYRLSAAFLERGSESARVRTGRMGKRRVAAGAEVEVSWGGPLVGEVPAPRVSRGQATVNPTVKIFGENGEEYYDFLPTGKVPSYQLFDAETGKRVAKGKFPAG